MRPVSRRRPHSANYGSPDKWRVSGAPLSANDTDGSAWLTAEPSAVGLHVTGGQYASSGVIKDSDRCPAW